MDPADAQALIAEVARSAVSRDLDELAGELTRLRNELQALRAESRRPPPPMSPQERRQQVIELRQRGLSIPKIAQYLEIAKSTAARDAHGVGVPRSTRGVRVNGTAG